MDNKLNNIELLHCEMCDVIDGLKGLESMLHVFYKSMIEIPNDDMWMGNEDEHINLLSNPYIMIINSIKSTISHLDDLYDRMDLAIMSLDKVS